MQNKIRVHPEQLKHMLNDPFWKKMYDNDPDKFEVSEQPPEEQEDGDISPDA